MKACAQIDADSATEQPTLAQIKLNLCFRPLAWMYLIAFFATLTISGILTFTSTNFSAETDKIMLFYGVFNPCIWFDHYPAKVAATAGMGIFLLIGLAYNLLLLLHSQLKRGYVQNLWSSMLVTCVCLVAVIFVNVFTTNLYPLEPHRRLHGAHHTINLIGASERQQGEDPLLSVADQSMVRLHTFFYIAWLFSEFTLSVYILNLSLRHFTQGRAAKVKAYLVFAVFSFGMLLHGCAMLVIICQTKPKNEWYFKVGPSQSIQAWFVWLDAWTGSSFWGWLPCMLFRFAVPADVGISMTCRLGSMMEHDAQFWPDQWVNRALCIIAAVLTLGGVFSNALRDQSSSLVLISTLSEPPFSYFGAPAWLSAVCFACLGIAGSVLHKSLETGKLQCSLAVHGAVEILLFYGCLLRILQRADFTKILFYALIVSSALWVLHLHLIDPTGKPMIGVAYIVIGVIALSAALFTKALILHYLPVAWIMLYSYFTPKDNAFHIKIGEVDQVWTKLTMAEIDLPHTSPQRAFSFLTMCRASCLLESSTWRLVLIPLGAEFVTMFMSAAEGNKYLFLSSSMNFDHHEPWGMFVARWYLWILAGASICSFKVHHLPKGLKWLGWWNLFLIYGALFTGCKQDHEEGEKYALGVLEVMHLVFGAIFLITCWLETCTVWYPNTIFTWIFGGVVFIYLLLYVLTAFVVPLQTGIPFIWDHPEMVAQHAIVIVAYVTQSVKARVINTSEWAPRTWCFSCLCPQLVGSDDEDEDEDDEEYPLRQCNRQVTKVR